MGIPSFSQNSANGLVYHGRILKPSGDALEDTNVRFEVRIYGREAVPTSKRCLLYREEHTNINMTGSTGVFELKVGEGTRLFAPPEIPGASGIGRLFLNSPSFTLTTTTCTAGTNDFTAESLDADREIEVTVQSGATTINVPAQKLRAMPWAMQAMEIGGYSSDYLAKLNAAVPSQMSAGALMYLSNNAVVNDNGTPTNYSDDTVRLTNLINPTGPQDAATKDYVDTIVGSGFSAGNGISITAGVIATRLDNTTIEFDGSGIMRVKALGIDTAQLAAGAVTAAKLNQMGATLNQVLKWNGTNWAPAADNDTVSTYTAGDGLTLTANDFDVNVDTTTISLNGSDQLQVSDGGIGYAKLNSTGATVNDGMIVKDSSGRLFNKQCAANQVVAWSVANGWDCINPSALVGVQSTTLTSNNIWVGNGSNVATAQALPTCGANQYITYNGTAWSCATDAGAAGAVASAQGTAPVKVNGDNAAHTGAVTITVDDATAAAKGIMQVGTGLAVAAGVVSVPAPTCTAGQYLTFDGTNWTCGTPTDTNTTYTAGDALSLTAGDFDVNVDNVGIEVNTDALRLKDGGVTAAKLNQMGAANNEVLKWNGAAWAPAADAGITAVAGQTLAQHSIWQGNASNQAAVVAVPSCGANQYLKYNNGAGWTCENDAGAGGGLTSLNTLTAATQTFAVGTTGTDFNIDSSGSTHTFHIPTASASNRGALSSADWTTFNNKLGTTLNDSLIWVGNGSNVATAVNPSGDVDISNTGVMAIQAGVIVDADVNAAANITATKLGTGAVDNTEFNYLDGVTSAIQTQLDAKVANGGGTPSITTGTFAARPAFGTAGRIYIASDTNALYRDTGAAWVLIGDGAGTGDLTDVTVTAPLAVTNSSGPAPNISITAGGTDDDILQWNGSAWVNRTVATCTAGQYLTFDGTTWTCSAPAGTVYTAGDGLALTAGDFDINVDDSTVEINSDTLRVKDGGITLPKIASSAYNTGEVASTLVMRDGSGNLEGSGILGDSIIMKGSTSGTVTLQAPAAPTSYALTYPSAQGGAGEVLSNNGSGVLSWASLSPAGKTLTQHNIWLGNGSNVAAAVALPSCGANQYLKYNNAGGLTCENDAGASGTVASLTPTAPLETNATTGTITIKLADGTVTGQVLKWNGTAWAAAADADTTYTAGDALTLTAGDFDVAVDDSTIEVNSDALRVKDGGITAAKLNQMGATNNQILKWNGTAWAPSSDAGLTAVVGSSLTSANIWVGDGSNLAAAVNPSGDVDIDNAGVFSIGAGVIVDADVNAAANITATKLGTGAVDNTEFNYLDGVTSAIQTQLDAKVANGGGTPSITTGTFAARPAFGTAGRIYIASDTNALYRDTGAAWVLIGDGAGTGDVTDVTATAPLTVTNSSGPNPNVAITAGGTDDDILQWNGSAWVNRTVATCTAGQYLTFDGTTWACSAPAGTAYTAGAGLALTANDFAVNVDDSTIEINSDTLRVKDGGITLAKIASSAYNTGEVASTLVMRDGSGNTDAAGVSADSIIMKGSTSGTVTLQAPAAPTSYALTYPSAQGGSGQVLSNNGSGVLSWVTALTSTTAFMQNGNSFGAKAVLGTNDNNALGFEVNNDEKVTILASGNVGIGDTTPAEALTVQRDQAAVTAIEIVNWNAGGGTALKLFNDTALMGTIGANGSTTGAPYANKLVVASGSSASGILIEAGNANPIDSYTNGLLRMSIASGGNVGIGPDTTPDAKLDVQGGAILAGAQGNGAGLGGEVRFEEHDGSAGNNYVALRAPDSITANVTWTLPSADGTSNQVLTTNGSGVLTWATPSAAAPDTDIDTASPFETSVGYQAGNAVAAGGLNNSLFGYQAGDVISTGDDNTGIGFSALGALTTGSNNTTLGSNAGIAMTTGGDNTLVGKDAGLLLTTSTGNVAVGFDSLSSITAVAPSGVNTRLNVAVGQRALGSLQRGEENVAIGYNTLGTNYSSNRMYRSTAVGSNALRDSNPGDYFSNDAFGAYALVALTTGSDNVAVGGNAGSGITTGTTNAIFGKNAASNMTAGSSGNVVLGNSAGPTGAGAVSNKLYIDNSANNYPLIGGDFSTDIVSISGILEAKPTSATGSPSPLRFYEDGDNGSNYVAFKAADAITANVTWTLPAADGTANQVLQTDGAGVLSWATPSGGLGGTGTTNKIPKFTAASTLGDSAFEMSSTGTLNFTGTNPMVSFAGSNVLHTYGVNSVGLGKDALYTSDSGSTRNVAIGTESMYDGYEINDNVGVGYRTLYAAGGAGGFYAIGNVAVGSWAMDTLNGNGAQNNTAVGSGTSNSTGPLTRLTTGADNVAIGFGAGSMANTTSTGNIFIGKNSGPTAATIVTNKLYIDNTATAIPLIGGDMTAGSEVVSIGGILEVKPNSATGSPSPLRYYEDGDNGSNYVAFRSPDALAGDVTWVLPSADGTLNQVLTTNGSGTLSWSTPAGGASDTDIDTATPFETSVGYQAGNATTGVNNSFFGYQAGDVASTATNNTGIGYSALGALTTGTYNVAVGSNAGKAFTTGQRNIAIGTDASAATTTQADTIAIGYEALKTNTTGGYGNIAIGTSSLKIMNETTTNGRYNVAIGLFSMQGVNEGADNTAVGSSALGGGFGTYKNSNSTAIGSHALENANAGQFAGNDAVGSSSLQSVTTGINNAALGARTAYSITTGSENTILGRDAGMNMTGASNSNVIIGYAAGPTGAGAISNKLYIDNSANDTPLIYGDFSANTVQINGTVLGKAATSNATTTVDFGTGNLQYTSLDCGTFALHNMKDGASYSFAVQGTAVTTCAFNAFSGAGTGALTMHLPPDHGATTSGKHTMYTFVVMGSHVYASWIPGY